MRIKIKFKQNSEPIQSIMNSHINGFINKVLGENNKWHGSFSPYAVSSMHNGVLKEDGTIQYPNGGYFVISSCNTEFIGEIINGLLSLNNAKILSMEYDSFDVYDVSVMSDYSIVFFEKIYLQKKNYKEKRKEYTFENCSDYIQKLRENTIKKLIKEGISERSANSIQFIPFHKEKWKVQYCKYKTMNKHNLVHQVSNITLLIKGNKKARKLICDMGIGNCTGYGFGFAKFNED